MRLGALAENHDALITKVSPWTVPETAVRLRAVVAARGMEVIAVIDVGGVTPEPGFALRDAVLILWADGATTTPIITAAPLSAFDLPPRALVWADELDTKVTYLAPAAFVARYDIAVELAATLAGITDIVDVVIDR